MAGTGGRTRTAAPKRGGRARPPTRKTGGSAMTKPAAADRCEGSPASAEVSNPIGRPLRGARRRADPSRTVAAICQSSSTRRSPSSISRTSGSGSRPTRVSRSSLSTVSSWVRFTTELRSSSSCALTYLHVARDPCPSQVGCQGCHRHGPDVRCVQMVSGDHDNRASQCGGRTAWGSEIGPPDLSAPDHHSTRASDRRAASRVKPSGAVSTPATARLICARRSSSDLSAPTRRSKASA